MLEAGFCDPQGPPQRHGPVWAWPKLVFISEKTGRWLVGRDGRCCQVELELDAGINEIWHCTSLLSEPSR